MDLKEKKVLVIGLARSGMAAIRLLHEIGVQDITLSERKEVEDRSPARMTKYSKAIMTWSSRTRVYRLSARLSDG